MKTANSFATQRRLQHYATRRASEAEARLLRIFLANPIRWWYGYDLYKQHGLKQGTLYPQLEKLEKAGWVESHQEVICGRNRKSYHLNESFIDAAKHRIEDYQAEIAAEMEEKP